MTKELEKLLKESNKKLNILLILELAKLGMDIKRVAKVLGMSDKTISNLLPFKEIKDFMREDKNEKNRYGHN